MKILIDENIDVNFKNEFSEFEVSTVKDNYWIGIENGELLKMAIANNSTVFITHDSNLKYQQNLSKFDISIIILKSIDSRLKNLNLLVPQIKNYLNKINQSEKFDVIEITL
ncbi:MAG: hypothetical protein M3R36_03090 [Bacteroidota bacterium]|nr:hypothetical protein [Bacteroidota bacterium]